MKERLDDLQLDGLKLYQNTDGYNFTSDAVLLANFVYCKKKDVCVEIGTGSGIISILVEHKNQLQKIYAFENQGNLSKLAQKNVNYNKKQEKIEIIADKIQNYNKYLDVESIDIVFSNPPYFSSKTNMKSENDEISSCKFEKNLTIDELLQVSKKILKFGGKLFLVFPAERSVELFYKMKENKIEPKRFYYAQPNENKNASVVLVEGVKGAKEGTIVLPTLITNSLDGNYIQTLQKMYKGE